LRVAQVARHRVVIPDDVALLHLGRVVEAGGSAGLASEHAEQIRAHPIGRALVEGVADHAWLQLGCIGIICDGFVAEQKPKDDGECDPYHAAILARLWTRLVSVWLPRGNGHGPVGLVWRDNSLLFTLTGSYGGWWCVRIS